MEQQTTTTAKQPLTSEKLETLKAAYIAAFQLLGTPEILADPFGTKAVEAKMNVAKIEGEMKAETATLNKAANDAEIAEKRNERLKLSKNLLAAHEAFLKMPKNVSAEQKAEIETAFNTALEIVDNELLAKYAASRPAKADNGTTASRSTADKAKIIELHNAGKTEAEIQQITGTPRSTVWHVIDKAVKAGTANPKK